MKPQASSPFSFPLSLTELCQNYLQRTTGKSWEAARRASRFLPRDHREAPPLDCEKGQGSEGAHAPEAVPACPASLEGGTTHPCHPRGFPPFKISQRSLNVAARDPAHAWLPLLPEAGACG